MIVISVIAVLIGVIHCRYLYVKYYTYAEFTDDSCRELRFKGNLYRVMDMAEIDENLSRILDHGLTEYFNEDTDSYGKYHYKKKNESIWFAFPKEWGDKISLYDDQKMISIMNDDESISYYVRDDIYDEYKSGMTEYAEAANNADYGKYYFNSYQRVWQSGVEYDEEETCDRRIVIDDESAEAINKAMSASEEELISYSELHSGDENHLIIYLGRYDEDLRLYEGRYGYALIKDYDRCYFRYYEWKGDPVKDSLVYPFSDSDAESIKKIFEDYPNGIETDHSL